MATVKRYAKDQSPFYGIKSKKKLAAIFGVSHLELAKISKNPNGYEKFTITKLGKKPRDVQKPKGILLQIHKRTQFLLARIKTPDYLHSAVRSRSYMTNAKAHVGKSHVIKIDIRSFFNNVKKKYVKRFFVEDMKCSADAAGMLADILTCDGHLPTGSSVSPILSYFSHKDMFDEIERLCLERSCTMTCYVDDISISGSGANGELLYLVRNVIHSRGLRTHKRKRFEANASKIITGVVVKGESISLPNRRHQMIVEGMRSYKSESDEKTKYETLKCLVGRLFEAAQIDKKFEVVARKILPEYKDLSRNYSSKSNTKKHKFRKTNSKQNSSVIP